MTQTEQNEQHRDHDGGDPNDRFGSLPQFVVVEGPVGVGKTSLARRIAHSLGAQLLLEQPEKNPFLERFYSEPRRYALSTQLHFLFQRMSELASVSDALALARSAARSRPFCCVADYLADKDPLFAQMNLERDELDLYQKVYGTVQFELPRPDLVIYLQAPVPVLEDRIRKRGVAAEQIMSREYLQRICDTYASHFLHYTDAPLLIINAESINFVDNDKDYEALLEYAMSVGNGRHFFNPLPSTTTP